MEICFFTKNFPAPNHYGLPKSVFDKYKRILCKCDSFMVESPPFNQSTKVCFDIFAPIIITQLWFILLLLRDSRRIFDQIHPDLELMKLQFRKFVMVLFFMHRLVFSTIVSRELLRCCQVYVFIINNKFFI